MPQIIYCLTCKKGNMVVTPEEMGYQAVYGDNFELKGFNCLECRKKAIKPPKA